MLESIFNKVADFQVCSSIKKRLQHRRFPVNIAKVLRTPIILNSVLCRIFIPLFKMFRSGYDLLLLLEEL